MHEFRVKDVTKTGLIDDSLWLFGCGSLLFNGRRFSLDLRGFRGLVQFQFFTITGSADTSCDECVNKQPQEQQ